MDRSKDHANERLARQCDILLALFKQYIDLGIYHQGQTSATTNLVLILAGALIGIATYDQNIEGDDILVAYALIGLGLFGMIWSAKHHERYDYFTARADVYRNKLAELWPELEMPSLEAQAELNSSRQSRMLRLVRVRYLWMSLHIIIVGVGILLAVIYFGRSSS